MAVKWPTMHGTPFRRSLYPSKFFLPNAISVNGYRYTRISNYGFLLRGRFGRFPRDSSEPLAIARHSPVIPVSHKINGIYKGAIKNLQRGTTTRRRDSRGFLVEPNSQLTMPPTRVLPSILFFSFMINGGACLTE